jgi:hypothetical protein
MVRAAAMALLLVATAACDREASEAANTVAVAASVQQDGGTLRALALVNEPDLAKAQPYRERHALIDRLRETEDAKRIDRRLNLALDLRQAGDAPDPCGAWETALAEIERSGDAYFVPHLRQAAVPSACASTRQDAVLAALTGTSERDPEPEPEAAAGSPPPEPRAAPRPPTPKRARRPRAPAAPPPDERPAPPPAKQPAPPSVAAKIDEELKPFGL